LTDTDPPTPRRGRWGRRLARAGLGLAIVMLVVVAWPPSRVTLQTVALIPSILQMGPQPLALAPEPTHRVVLYTAPDGERLPADLWLPATASAERPVGAVVFVSGINSKGRAHPALAQLAEAMSRAGAAAYIPELPRFFHDQVDASEVGRIVAAFEDLAARPEIDRDRIGIMGVSVGGSLSLIAAADPAIADQLAWVGAFGAYADAGDLATMVLSRQYELDGEVVSWEPRLLVRQVSFRLVIDQVPDEADRDALRAAYKAYNDEGIHPFPVVEVELRTEAGRAAQAIVATDSLAESQAAVAAAPEGMRDVLDGISPLSHLDEIHARVYLMHDTGDHHIPFVASRQMAAVLAEAGVDVRLGEFRLFDHVQPDTTDLGVALPELWKLFWYLRDVAAETL